MMHLGAWQAWIPVLVQVVATAGSLSALLIARTDRIRRKLDQQQASLDQLTDQMADVRHKLEECDRSIGRAHDRIDLLYLARGGEHE